MKNLLILAFFASPTLWAQSNECSSIWIYQPYNTCRHADHGFDESTGRSIGIIREWSDWRRSSEGKDHQRVCERVRDKFNLQNKAVGKKAELPESGTLIARERKRDLPIEDIRQWECNLEVTQYEFAEEASAACGTENVWRQALGDPETIPGKVSCLSCSNVKNLNQKVDCLKAHLTEVIQTNAIELRATDLEALRKEVKTILSINRHRPIKNLNEDADTLGLFVNFLDQ